MDRGIIVGWVGDSSKNTTLIFWTQGTTTDGRETGDGLGKSIHRRTKKKLGLVGGTYSGRGLREE